MLQSDHRSEIVHGPATYVYDAFGHRVRAVVNGVNHDFLYDLSGRTIDQLTNGTLTRTEAYAGSMHVATYVNSTTEFDNSDWLSTVRVRADVAGNKIESCTSLPFGEDLTCTGTEDSPLHFTGKERDSESGLDQFGARYYANAMGRFMTPDWAAKPISVPYADFGNPQSLNLYSYVKNNPTTTRDADGHCGEDLCIVEGGAAIYIGGAALLAGTAAVLNTPAGQRSLSTFTSAASQSISDTVHAIGNFFHPDNSGQAASPPGTTTTNVTTGTPASTSQQGAVNNDPINSKTLEPGPFAGDGVPARGPGRDFTQGERDAINAQGRDTGCHTCGSTDPGTKSGNFIPDHQPPSALNTSGASQTLYPHCLGCSQTQGGEVNAAKPKPPDQNQ